MRVWQRNPKAINARHSAPKNIHKHHNKYCVSKKNSYPSSHVFPNTCVCMCVYGGSFVHAHIHIHKMQFLCTNMFAKYAMRPKTYNDMLNKRK